MNTLPASLALALVSLPFAFGAIPGAGAQEGEVAAAPQPQSRGEGRPHHEQGRSSVVDGLMQVHQVLGQAIGAAPGVELTGTRLGPWFADELQLPPSVGSGSALSHAKLLAVRVERFEGEELSGADGERPGCAVSMGIAIQVAPDASAELAADMLGLILASGNRVSVVAQSKVAPVADQPGWSRLSFDLRCSGSESARAEESKSKGQGAACAEAGAAEPMSMQLRRLAQDRTVRMGAITVQPGGGDSEGDQTWRVEHRFHEHDEDSRALRLGNFFYRLRAKDQGPRVLSFRSTRMPNGDWKQAMTVR